jgi:hypothetical protein
MHEWVLNLKMAGLRFFSFYKTSLLQQQQQQKKD